MIQLCGGGGRHDRPGAPPAAPPPRRRPPRQLVLPILSAAVYPQHSPYCSYASTCWIYTVVLGVFTYYSLTKKAIGGALDLVARIMFEEGQSERSLLFSQERNNRASAASLSPQK